MFRYILALLFTTTACLSFPVSHDEVSRRTSSTGRLDAVLVETNGGATTSFGYLVYVVPRASHPSKGAEVAWLYGASRNDSAYGANVRWESPTQLVVEYREALQAEVRRHTKIMGGDTVTVLLRSGVTDSTAPRGGMLHNVENTRQ